MTNLFGIRYLAVGLFVILLSGCNEDLKSRINTLNEENSRLKDSNSKMAIELAATRDDLLRLRQKAETRGLIKPPVTISFRAALLGHGLVAIINTYTKSSITVLVTWKSSATGVNARQQIHLDGAHSVELGHMEGFPIEPGDTLSIEHTEFEPLRVVAPRE